ncbi:MAG: HNH endonuclease signature motif containing protein, partial [Nakamurella sp.]
IPPPIRRAITLRDKGCSFPGCDRPPGWTDAHHVRSWLHDGETAYGNSCLLCRFHHTTVHKGDWAIVFAADGIPEFIPPPWVDPDRKPRRNTTNHLTSLLPHHG